MWWVVNATPRPPYPLGKRLSIHCTRGWEGSWTGLGGFGKSPPHRDSIPRPSLPLRSAIPTELSGPYYKKSTWRKLGERGTIFIKILGSSKGIRNGYFQDKRRNNLLQRLYVQVTVHRDNLLINNQQDASSIQNLYFVTKLYLFRASSVRVQLITPDDGHRRCPKQVEFCDKIKILDTWCILLVIYTKIIAMHGHLNINDWPLGGSTPLCVCNHRYHVR
jgi:hypothetical protein